MAAAAAVGKALPTAAEPEAAREARRSLPARAEACGALRPPGRPPAWVTGHQTAASRHPWGVRFPSASASCLSHAGAGDRGFLSWSFPHTKVSVKSTSSLLE